MRNAAIISISAFYLLLATGWFACTVHCTESYLGKARIAHCHEDKQELKEDTDNHKKRKESNDKNCSCCDQHGSYMINENIKVSFDVNILPVSKLIKHKDYSEPTIYYNVIPLFSLRTGVHGPPWLSGKSISIKFRSLLI